jgi:hypothetical protein
MITLTKKMMDHFIRLLNEEQSIDADQIPIICEILEEVTGYDSRMEDNDKSNKNNYYKSLTKKQREIYKQRKRTLKHSNTTITED